MWILILIIEPLPQRLTCYYLETDAKLTFKVKFVKN